MERVLQEFPFITLITGDVNTGKSTKLQEKISSSDDYIGFVTPPVKFPDGEKGYRIEGINIPFNMTLSSPYPLQLKPPLFFWKRWFFSGTVFKEITKYIIENQHLLNNKTLIIDEIGPLESEKKGWYKLLQFAVKNKIKADIIVRKNFVDNFIEILRAL